MTVFRTLSLALLASLALAGLPSGAARADGAIVQLLTAADKARLQRFEATRTAAVSAARSAGAPADVVLLDADPRAVDPLTIRTIGVRGTWVGGIRTWDAERPD